MAKKRIHQIAKELDIASADVLHKAKELGFEVKTASSGLVPEDEELLKLAFAEESSEQDIEEETSVEINEEATLTEEDQVIEKDETIDASIPIVPTASGKKSNDGNTSSLLKTIAAYASGATKDPT